MTFYQSMPYHDGELQMQKIFPGPMNDNPTVPMLSPQASNMLQRAPLLAIGTLDAEHRPWTTLWGGDYGFVRPVAQSIIAVRTAVTGKHDPVVESLVGTEAHGEVKREEGNGRMIGGLTIDLETRKRVKLYGRMIAGALGMREEEEGEETSNSTAEIQLIVKIEQSLGNCPKYLNQKHIMPAISLPRLVSDSPRLPQDAIDLLAKADLFFISSSHSEHDMDTNNRGGVAGFVRVLSNEESGAVLVYPEFSGNRLYQTLGNLRTTPLGGLCVPDFETGDMLYLTGTTEILVGKDAAALLPRSNLAVKLKVTAARFVASALAFRGTTGEPSPYNPVLRLLTTEHAHTASQEIELQQATLLSQTVLTPSISRFRFSLNNAAAYSAGQYVTLDFSSHLDIGYSHMRDDDPRSLNDDFVRTFTVSSPPGMPADPVHRLKDDQFEITIRKVGVVTGFLFKHFGTENSGRERLEVGVKGFGGEFEVNTEESENACFIAAGVGITPLLPSLSTLQMDRINVFWTLRADDVGLLLDTLEQHPHVKHSMTVYITGLPADKRSKTMASLQEKGIAAHARRLNKIDFDATSNKASKVYACTGTPLRKQLAEWFPGKELIFEDFNF